MANPLFGNQGANNMANMMSNVNPQAVQKVMNIINRGANLKDIVVAFKKNGITPQVAEQILCMANPQLKQIKEQMNQMQQSGMSQQDMFAQFAKQANVEPNQITQTYDNLMKLIK